MDTHEFTSLLENLERQLAAWSPADCTHLLGILERVRVSAWAKVLGSSHDAPQALSPKDGRRVLTLPQVAERLSIPEGYAYDLARRGVLPVVRLGKYVRVPLAEFEAWLDQQTSLERRIDRDPPGFHSARVPKNHRARAITDAKTRPRGARRKRDGPAWAPARPNAPVGVQPQPAMPRSAAGPGSVDAEGSQKKG